MSKEAIFLILTLDTTIIHWLLATKILKNRKTVLLLEFVNFSRFVGSILLLSISGANKSDVYLFFYGTSFILLLTEFYLLYRLTESYLPPLIIIVTILAMLQLSFIFIDAAFFLKHNNYLITSQLEYLPNLAIFLQPLFFLFILFRINSFNRAHNILDQLFKLNKKYTAYSISCFFFFFFLLYFHLVSSYSFNLPVYIYSYLILIISLSSLYYLFNQIIVSAEETTQLEVQIQNIIYSKQQIDLANEFRHDYRSILLSLSDSLKNDNITLATQQLEDIIDYSKPLLQSNYFEQLSNLKLPTIQAILAEFLLTCKKNDIDVSISIKKEISSVGINLIDLSRCISILCNNAIEASIASKDPAIHISISASDDSFIFLIKNTANKKIDLKNALKKGQSTKAGHKGLGLYIFTKILKQYRNTQFFFKNDDHNVTVSFSISLT